MKKLFFVSVMALVVLANIAAAPMATSSVALIGVSNGGGGPMFTFRVDGPVSLNGIVHSVVGEYQGDFPLSCNQVDATTVICHASKKLSGDSVTVEFGGSRFWTQVPEAQEPQQAASCQYIYDVYDWNNAESADVEDSDGWASFFSWCQDTPVQDGDTMESNGWDGINYYDYQYYEKGFDGAYCEWDNPGPGYYYIDEDYSCWE